MILNSVSVSVVLMVISSAGSESSSTLTPKSCCPHSSILDPWTRLCIGGEQLVLDCGGHTKFLFDSAELDQPILVASNGALIIGTSIHAQPGQFCLVNLTASRGGPKKPKEGAADAAVACHINESPGIPAREIFILFCYFASLSSLVLVLIAHICLSELRDLQGKCHMATVLGLLLGLGSLLIVITLTNDVSEVMCQLLAFFVYFWLLSAFFWLNVTAFNVWRSVYLYHVSFEETRLFLVYSLYAWGVPLALLAITATMHFLPEGYAVLRPYFGLHTCWFHDGTTQWSYFYGPVAILLSMNCIFFVWTTVYMSTDYTTNCLPMKRRLKRRFLLSVKMYLVMGISWVFELISTLDNSDSFMWFIMDAFNILQGVVILMVLVVLRRRFWSAIHKRRPCGIDAPQWAIKRFLADETNRVGRNMEELRQLQSTEAA